jgi:hypothetical protein
VPCGADRCRAHRLNQCRRGCAQDSSERTAEGKRKERNSHRRDEWQRRRASPTVLRRRGRSPLSTCRCGQSVRNCERFPYLAGDGRRRVRAGSCLTLGLSAGGGTEALRSMVVEGHFRRKREAPLTVGGVPPHTQRPSPDLSLARTLPAGESSPILVMLALMLSYLGNDLMRVVRTRPLVSVAVSGDRYSVCCSATLGGMLPAADASACTDRR